MSWKDMFGEKDESDKLGKKVQNEHGNKDKFNSPFDNDHDNFDNDIDFGEPPIDFDDGNPFPWAEDSFSPRMEKQTDKKSQGSKVDEKDQFGNSIFDQPDFSEKNLTPGKENAGKVAPTDLPGSKANPNSTREKAMRAGMGMMENPGYAHVANSLMNSGLTDRLSDEQAAINAGLQPERTPTPTKFGEREPVPPKVENLPAIIRKEMILNKNHVDPEWHQVKHLPGYLASPIRALGRQVFANFTPVEIENIQIVCTLINPERDVRGLMKWISENGIRDDRATVDFSDRIENMPGMPNVQCDVQVWNTKGFTFLMVKDFMGYYVYGWAGGRGTQVEGSKDKKRLK